MTREDLNRSAAELISVSRRSRSRRNNGTSLIGRCGFTSLVVVLLTGCAVGPNYKRPAVTVPDGYRGLAPEATQQTFASLGDEKWWTVFQDLQLQALIREALVQNYDVRIAATRVLQAQASLGITRADQFPTVTAGAGAVNVRSEMQVKDSLYAITVTVWLKVT